MHGNFDVFCQFSAKSDLYPNNFPSIFLLMILVQNLMLIKNHIEMWGWKSTETKLFTSKVLEKSWKVIIIKKRGLNTIIPLPCWKINKLQNNQAEEPSRMKVKFKNNHEKMWLLEHHYSLAIFWKIGAKKYLKCQWHSFLRIICVT